jgi:hypothetical protein
MITNYQISAARHTLVLPAALLLSVVYSTKAAAVEDIMLQIAGEKIVTGIVDDQTGVGTLRTRVYGRQFQLVSGSFRASNPGFFGLRTGDPGMPPGALGFPADHDINFDLLPMTIDDVSSNLFYWDGSDANGGGVDVSDVNFVAPTTGVSWTQFDDTFSPYVAAGTDQFVTAGLIDRTSADIWPDAFDSGTFHAHLAMLVNDSDSNSGTQPPAGIYMIAWQARSVGFETSDPFFLAMRSPTISDAVRDVAVDWVEQQLNIPGDYDQNGEVDAADYVLWRQTNGQSGAELAADGDGNQQVNHDDYTFWRQRFGNKSQLITSNAPGASSSVGQGSRQIPEPAVAPLILLSALAWGSFIRPRQLKLLLAPKRRD